MRRGLSDQRPKGWGYPLRFRPSFEGAFQHICVGESGVKTAKWVYNLLTERGDG